MDEVLQEWAKGPDLVEAAVAGLTEFALDFTPDGAEWSIRHIVHHMAESDARWMMLVQMALIKSGSTFSMAWHPGNKGIADALRYAERPIGPSLALFRAYRVYITQMLMNVGDDWQECYIVLKELPEWSDERESSITVGEYISGLARHVQEHVEEIGRVRGKWEEKTNGTS